jgi:hypothetical protein
MRTFRVIWMGGGDTLYPAHSFEVVDGYIHFISEYPDGRIWPRVIAAGTWRDVEPLHHAHEHDEYREHEGREYPFAAGPTGPTQGSHAMPQPPDPHVDHRDAGGRFMKEP